ncbi:MAG: hypothetical protein GF344_20015, partial [Chitinivibrionales bacterium]|nr:hypothetical protein [Chitinivibrionales bacterium]MBD3358900.1 hypothetical protein [Chitinivibrionales bacterium]
MNRRFVTYAVGKLLQVLAAVLLVPACIAIVESRPLVWPDSVMDVRLLGFLIAIPLSFFIGTILVFLPRQELEGPGVREGFAIVTFGWIILTLMGCVPLFVYLLFTTDGSGTGHVFRCFTDAFFEIMSGFTTTGATIITDVEVLPRGILFWRSMT